MSITEQTQVATDTSQMIWEPTFQIPTTCVFNIRGQPIIGADIKHFTDYRYRPF